ncbi:MAG: hypothetical protein GVY13_17830 [Alphaproteobacteria bacterium]|nr:hypothetical protein [Alphaproteobacteria bacterium]
MTSGEMINVLIQSVTVAIALLGLLRPEIGKLFRKWSTDLDIDPLPYIQIGFTNLGPTMDLFITIMPINHDQFIKSMNITFEARSQKIRKNFKWTFLRPEVFTVSQLNGDLSSVEIRAATPFVAAANESRVLNIQFIDSDMMKEVQSVLKEVQTISGETRMRISSCFAALDKVAAIANALKETKRFIDGHDVLVKNWKKKLEELNPWHQDVYDIVLNISTERPRKNYKIHLEVEIKTEGITILDNNPQQIIMSILGFYSISYNTASLKILNYRKI